MQKKRKKKRRTVIRLIRSFYIFIVILSALIVGAFCTYKVLVQPPAMEQPAIANTASPAEYGENTDGLDRKDGFYTFLLFGMDNGFGNTDTIMVGGYDTIHQKLNIVSIPRDTLIETDRANKRINAVYANEGGATGLEKEISDLLGIPIDFYISVDLNAFVAIIDAIGGVEYDVPVDMDYEDPNQNLYIHLKKGVQMLDGEKALQLVRCRKVYASQDIGRIQTQQGFLSAVASQALRLENLSNVPKFASIFNQYIETDLKLENIIWFGEKLLSLDTSSDITFQTIPFNNMGAHYKGGAYVSLDIAPVVEMVNEKLNPFETQLTASDLDVISIVNNQPVYSRNLGA